MSTASWTGWCYGGICEGKVDKGEREMVNIIVIMVYLSNRPIRLHNLRLIHFILTSY